MEAEGSQVPPAAAVLRQRGPGRRCTEEKALVFREATPGRAGLTTRRRPQLCSPRVGAGAYRELVLCPSPARGARCLQHHETQDVL